MTVGEVKKLLDGHPDDMPVRISIETPPGFVCPDGALCDIRLVARGIDWHGHEVIVVPRYELRLRDDAEVDKWRNRK